MKILIALFVIAVVTLLEGFGIWMLLGIDEREPTSRGRMFWLGVLVATQWVGGLVYCVYRTLRPRNRRPLRPTSQPTSLNQGLRPHAGGV